ncbi:winged helix-turn-helix domain-containing protein, partial [Streptomyces sp. MBT65]|nr:winged helix-turn-helix domain-containing protein [Streptomyces sp. MBT65]
MHELTRAEARRIAVQAQLLDAHRPTELHAVVRQLTLLQIDPTAAIAPNADLVAW